MKSIRNWVTLAGFLVMVFALSATGFGAQGLATTHFAGTFTLPFEAQWGSVALQPGDYSLYYGRLNPAGARLVEVVGKEHGTPRVLILTQSVDETSAQKSALVCIRDGNALIVRSLEMSEIGQAAKFSMPRGVRLVAHKGNSGSNVQMAQGPKLIQRIPITLGSR